MFKIKLSKSKDQQTIVIRRMDQNSLSGLTDIYAIVFTDDITTPYNTITFDSGERSSFVSGEIEFTALRFFGTSTPPDEFYTVVLEFNGGVLTADPAGIAITLEAESEVFSKQGLIGVYSPDYRIDAMLMKSFMLLREMNTIEQMDSALQKRVDFTSRWDILKSILKY